MDADDSPDEEGPLLPFVHPDDRLWRHPSELAGAPRGAQATTTTAPAVKVRTVALVAGLAGALVASGVLAAGGELGRSPATVVSPVTRVVPPTTLAVASVRPSPGWPQVLDAVSASVVSLEAWAASGPRRASAVVFATDATSTYLLTDAAVVAAASPVDVTFDGGQPERARVLRSDPLSGIALLRVAGADHQTPGFGTVAELSVAEPVLVAGGRPGGAAPAVASMVSSIDCAVDDPATGDERSGLLALGGTLPPADDGGAVVDGDGAVVGLAVGLTTSDPADAGLAYAVPIDQARQVADDMLAGHAVAHPWLGVDAMSDLDPATARAMGVPGGAQLVTVDPNGPAAAAALHDDDVVVAVDGQAIGSTGMLEQLLDRATVGQTATVTYRRGAQLATTTVTVREQPAEG